MRPTFRPGRNEALNTRINGRIRAREVRVIDGQTNQQLGVMATPDAMRLARQKGLDLVEVAPNAVPPVCRIVDFGKYRYALSKQDKEKKPVGSRLKEIKFRVKIADHDYFTKIRHAENFLDKGSKVRVQLQFRGRENAHQELGFDVLMRVKNDLASMAIVEMDPKKLGRGIVMILSPLAANKRQRKWSVPSDDVEEIEEEPDEEPGEIDEETETRPGGEPAD